jgi:hypothetical protein
MLQGQQAEIATSLDDKPFVHWKGALSALSTFPDWRTPDPKCLGLGAHLSAVEFRRMRMRALSGELKLPDAKPADAAPAPAKPTPKA